MAKCIELQDFKAFAVQKQKTLVINVTVVIQILSMSKIQGKKRQLLGRKAIIIEIVTGDKNCGYVVGDFYFVVC